uniref:Uncharacterized protein n=1 Tax=Oncorhynchus kisutch TaxID=8019 RepID=A0A8C7I6Q2_ONCKI
MFFFLLWFGSYPVLSNLDSMPLSTLVLEDPSETTQNSLAQKLSKNGFVSYNLPMTDSNLSLLVKNRIKKEMEVHMDTF